MQDISALMKKYSIPLLHRRIAEPRPAGQQRSLIPKPIMK